MACGDGNVSDVSDCFLFLGVDDVYADEEHIYVKNGEILTYHASKVTFSNEVAGACLRLLLLLLHFLL